MEGRTTEDLDLVLKLIRHGVAAGRLRCGARVYPEAAQGLLKGARFHSERANALMERIIEGAAVIREDDAAPLGLPVQHRRRA